MQLMIAAAPPLRQMACGTQLPIANAAYRIENGVLCALPMPPALRGGAMLLTGAAGPFSPETAAGVVQECRRRRYGTVIVPFPAAELTEALAQPPAPVRHRPVGPREMRPHGSRRAGTGMHRPVRRGYRKPVVRLLPCLRAGPYRAGPPAPADGLSSPLSHW